MRYLHIFALVISFLYLHCSVNSYGEDPYMMADEIYPSLSIRTSNDDLPGSTNAIGTSNVVSKGNQRKIISFDSSKIFSSILKATIFSSYIGIGFLSISVLNVLLRRNNTGNVIDSLFGVKDIKQQNQILISENEQIKQLKADQDEIWNAILNIHNTQSDLKASTEAAVVNINSIQATIHKLEISSKKSIEEIISHLEEIDKGLTNNNEDTIEKIRELQCRWDDELKGLRSSMSELKQELPNILEGHDKLVTNKLQKFKDSLKEIIGTTSNSIKSNKPKQK